MTRNSRLQKFKTILRKLRDAWLIIGLTLALFLVIEILFSLTFAYRDANTVDPRTAADTYQNADWPQKYYREYQQSGNLHWLSYVYWRRKPYHGKYINVDSGGRRKTWKPPKKTTATKEKPLKIFFFGGSTMWGTGARDDFTIPSLFAKKLARRGIPARVTNFGETGYVSTQEVMALIRQLQQGNVPDLVIFYDGVNDTYSASQQQTAGLPQNEFHRVEEFNVSQRSRAPTAWKLALKHLSTVRFAQGLARRWNTPNPSEKNIPDPQTLARNVLDIHRQNRRIVDALAERYSFRALFYWQPTIFQKQHLTPYEQQAQQNHAHLRPFFQTTARLLKQRSTTENRTDFHNLQDIFSDVKKPLFVDWCHLGETGNDLIAQRILTHALSVLEKANSAEPTPPPHRLSAKPSTTE